MNGRSDGLNNIIRRVKIREIKSLVTPIEEDMAGGGYREKRSVLTYNMWITVVRLGRSSERIQLKL